MATSQYVPSVACLTSIFSPVMAEPVSASIPFYCPIARPCQVRPDIGRGKPAAGIKHPGKNIRQIYFIVKDRLCAQYGHGLYRQRYEPRDRHLDVPLSSGSGLFRRSEARETFVAQQIITEP